MTLYIHTFHFEYYSQNVFYRNIAPAQWFLRLIGVLPITRTGPGHTKFSIATLAFLYAFVFFIVLTVSPQANFSLNYITYCFFFQNQKVLRYLCSEKSYRNCNIVEWTIWGGRHCISFFGQYFTNFPHTHHVVGNAKSCFAY